MLGILLRKELRELQRTHKLLIMAAAFLVIGLISPLLAKYIPVLMGSIPNMPPGFADLIPEATAKDAIDQYLKNCSQLGLILVIILAMGSVAQEIERGTAAMTLSKPIRPSAFILSKWLAHMFNLLFGMLLAGVGCLIYTMILFEPLQMVNFLALNGMIFLFLAVYMSLALLASSLVSSQSMAAAGAFAALALGLVIEGLPRIGEYMPGELLKWGQSLFIGESTSAWVAVLTSLGIIILAVSAACLHFERKEI